MNPSSSWTVSFFLLILLFTSLVTATLFTTNSESTFNAGTYDNTFYNDTLGAVQLNATSPLGNYTSTIFAGGNVASWDNITWTEGIPYGEELPDNAQQETTLGEANMNGNVLLLHLNEEDGTIIDTSGSNNNGVAIGTTPGSGGIYNTAHLFDGDDVITIPHSSSLNITSALTLETWINPLGISNISIGSINDSITATLEFDTTDAAEPSFIPIQNEVYAVAYEGPGSDGFVSTFTILSDGTLGPVINSLEFDPAQGQEPDIIHITDTLYAIAYSGEGGDGFVATLPIHPNGTIGSVINSFEFDSVNGQEPDIIPIGDTTYALAYSGPSTDGFIITFPIYPNGTIGSIINSFEFDASNAQEPFLLPVTNNIYALAYNGPSGDGFVVTLPLETNGTIGSIIDTLEFDPVDGARPQLIHIAGTTYALSYDGPNGDGFVVTLTIDDDGQISNTVLDTFEYNPIDGTESSIIPVSRDVYALAYRGENGDGFVTTLTITPEGAIFPSLIDTLEFDTSDGRENMLISITNNIYAVAYRGTNDDGFITTFTITTHKGIFKAGAYELDANQTTAFAIFNGTLTAPLSAGWNHVAFTYNSAAPADQEQLYVNGQLVASTSFTSPLNTTTHPLLIGVAMNATLDEIALYTRALTASEILDRYKRGILNLTLFVRNCTQVDCSDKETWDASFGSSPGNFTLSNYSYFQYRAHFTTLDALYTPELLNVTISATPFNTAPLSPSLNSPSNGASLSLSSVILNATVADAEGGPLTVFFIGNGNILTTVSGVSNNSDVTYNWTDLSDGTYTWSVIASDGDANTSSASFTFTVSLPSSPSSGGPSSSSSPDTLTSSGVQTNPPPGQSIRPSPPRGPAPAPAATPPAAPATAPTPQPAAAPFPGTGAAVLEPGEPGRGFLSGLSITSIFSSLKQVDLRTFIALILVFVLVFTFVMLAKTRAFGVFQHPIPLHKRPFTDQQPYKQVVLNKDLHHYLRRRYTIPTHSSFTQPAAAAAEDRKINKKQPLFPAQHIKAVNPKLEQLKEVYKIE